MKTISLRDSSFNVGSFYETEKLSYDCWTVKASEEEKEMLCFLEQTVDKKTLIDIGSCVGAFSLFFSDNSKEKVAHAIDGSHSGNLHLLQSMVLNKNKTIYPHKILIGDVDQERNYYTKPGDLHSLSFEVGTDRIIMLKLDTFVDLYNIHPDVIKIDVEGFEIKILENAHHTLSKYKPMLFLEGHSTFIKSYGTTAEQLVELAKKYDYTIWTLDGDRLTYDGYLALFYQKDVESIRTYWK